MRKRGRPPYPGELTPREDEVVALVAKGRTNREIADSLGISENGVRYHLNQAYSKLGIEGRDQLAAWKRQRWLPRIVAHLFSRPTAAIAAGTLALGTAGFVVVLATRGDAKPMSPCDIDSAIVAPGLTLTCLTSVTELQAQLSFPLHTPPGDGSWSLPRAVLVERPEGKTSYLAYRNNGAIVEFAEGPIPIAMELSAGTGRIPLVIDDLGLGKPALGWFSRSSAGAQVLWWCPGYDGGRFDANGPSLCPVGESLGITGLDQTSLSLLALQFWDKGSPQAQATANSGPASPTAVPFPPLRGERVQPLVDDLPTFPGAVEVDGFTNTTRGNAGEVVGHIQVFETTTFPEDVMAFFDAELVRLGWTIYHGNNGVAGETRAYSRAGEREWISVSTQYVPRPEDASQQPPPGFRGKGVPFLNRVDGKSRFWVTTWRQDE